MSQMAVENYYIAVNVIYKATQVESYTEDLSISTTDLLWNVDNHTGLEMFYRLIK